MRKLHKDQLAKAALDRPEGYLDDVAALAFKEDARFYYLGEANYQKLCQQFRPSASRSVSQFCSSEASRLHGKASKEVIARRESLCFAPCEFLTPSKKFPGGHYCAACRCGDRKRALLDKGKLPKLHRLRVHCPVHRDFNDA